MINFWLKGDFEDLKKMPLKDRLVMGMMSGLVDVYFAQEVIDIIVARYPRFSFTDNATNEDKAKVRQLKLQEEAGYNSYLSLRMIYKSEYDYVGDADKTAERLAKETAEQLVTKYGWRKENTNEKLGKV